MSYSSCDTTLERIERVLAGERGDFGLAPPEPLILMNVDYGIRFEKVPHKKIRAEVMSHLERSRLGLAKWSLMMKHMRTWPK